MRLKRFWTVADHQHLQQVVSHRVLSIVEFFELAISLILLKIKKSKKQNSGHARGRSDGRERVVMKCIEFVGEENSLSTRL